MSSRYNNLRYFFIEDFTDFKMEEVAQYILDKHKENELLKLALMPDKKLSSRAIWALSHCADLSYERVIPFHTTLINNLKQDDLHDGVKRGILRLFQEYPIPKKHETFMLDLCFSYLNNPSEPIAIRMFSMVIVFNISKAYPELLNELELTLHQVLQTETSPGILSRTKKIVYEINGIKKAA